MHSDLAGKPIKTVDDLADALKVGTIKPSQKVEGYLIPKVKVYPKL